MKLVPRRQYHDPFGELEQLHHDMHHLFDWSFGRWPERTTGLLETSWAPAVDVYDAKNDFVVKADLPGLSRDDLEVTVEKNILTITGEKKQDDKIEEDGYIRTERFYGSFHRSLALPADIDASKVRAEYKNGTLELVLPKKEEAKPKQITVNIK